MAANTKFKRAIGKLFSLIKHNITFTVTLSIALVLFIVLIAFSIGDLITRFSHEF